MASLSFFLLFSGSKSLAVEWEEDEEEEEEEKEEEEEEKVMGTGNAN